MPVCTTDPYCSKRIGVVRCDNTPKVCLRKHYISADLCRLALETNLTHLNICCFIICSSTANNKNTIYTPQPDSRLVPVHKLSRESSTLENRTIIKQQHIYFNTPHLQIHSWMHLQSLSNDHCGNIFAKKTQFSYLMNYEWIRMLKRMRSYGLTAEMEGALGAYE